MSAIQPYPALLSDPHGSEAADFGWMPPRLANPTIINLAANVQIGSSIFREGVKPYPALTLLNLLVQKQPMVA
jgi:hypothetical protein